MHVCTYVYLYICECVHLWCVCVYVCVYTWMYVCIYVCIYINKWFFIISLVTCMYMYMYMYVYMYMYMCVYLCLCMYRYMYTQFFFIRFTVQISWLFILLCFTIIQFVDAEQQVKMFILNWHKRTFCPSVRTRLYICILKPFRL